ncbi:MAG: nuclear transport factor 2 family protein [Phycisphaeraceae bacterium]|nr:nuclear transport factor 2 family protein [Phycisphaeraceae bacterium]
MSNTSTQSAPTFPTSPATQQVANRLHELCNSGKYHEAMQELYADDAKHIEAMEMPGSPYKRITEGKPALLKMSEHWGKTNTVHSASCGKPLFNGDQFTVEMKMDVTCGDGPMAGQRMAMSETCLYSVKNGKISEARFFYGCDAK